MRILIAEDDATVAEFVAQGLRQNGHSVESFRDGRDALSFCLYNPTDLVVLDRMLPGMDGLSVLKALRASGRTMPVIFLTALGDVEDRVAGLLAGADDYLVKPFHFSELLARITVVARRPAAMEEVTKLVVHDLELDLLSRVATRADMRIELLAKEFSILESLMRRAGRIVTKTMILEIVWQFDFHPRTTLVETHVSRLRAKVDKPFGLPLIHTTRNLGYSIHGPR